MSGDSERRPSNAAARAANPCAPPIGEDGTPTASHGRCRPYDEAHLLLATIAVALHECQGDRLPPPLLVLKLILLPVPFTPHAEHAADPPRSKQRRQSPKGGKPSPSGGAETSAPPQTGVPATSPPPPSPSVTPAATAEPFGATKNRRAGCATESRSGAVDFAEAARTVKRCPLTAPSVKSASSAAMGLTASAPRGSKEKA